MEISQESRQENSIIQYNTKEIQLTNQTLQIPCFLSKDYCEELNIQSVDDINKNLLTHLMQKTKINIVLIGCEQKRLSLKQQCELQSLKLGIDSMTIASACRSYNLLLSDFRPVGLITLND